MLNTFNNPARIFFQMSKFSKSYFRQVSIEFVLKWLSPSFTFWNIMLPLFPLFSTLQLKALTAIQPADCWSKFNCGLFFVEQQCHQKFYKHTHVHLTFYLNVINCVFLLYLVFWDYIKIYQIIGENIERNKIALFWTDNLSRWR